MTVLPLCKSARFIALSGPSFCGSKLLKVSHLLFIVNQRLFGHSKACTRKLKAPEMISQKSWASVFGVYEEYHSRNTLNLLSILLSFVFQQ